MSELLNIYNKYKKSKGTINSEVSEVAQLCPTLCDSMSHKGYSLRL